MYLPDVIFRNEFDLDILKLERAFSYPGQVLWMLPGKEKIQAAQKQNKNYGHVEGLWHWITSAANLACETLQGFTGQSIGRQMNAPDIDQKSDEEKNDSKRTSLDKRRAGMILLKLILYVQFPVRESLIGLLQKLL